MVAFLLVIAFLAAAGGIAATVVAVRRWRADQAELQRVASTFARYVPRSIVSELLTRKDEHLLSGREVTATILVCKIWNFAAVIEKLSPDDTLRYLNEFYAMAGTSIERHGGILHRFLDDGVVGLFGVPLEDREQEDHALRAAINIVRLVSLMGEKWRGQQRTPLRVGVGVSTGEVIAGDAGLAQRREYTVVGPSVAYAYRLAAATSDLNTYIVAARETVERVADLYHLLPVSGFPQTGVRALLDASIVRGRKREEKVTLPKAGTFRNTVLDDAESGDTGDLPDPSVPELDAERTSAAAAPSAAPAPAAAPFAPPPDAAPLKTRPVSRPGAHGSAERAARGFDMPELRMPRLGGHDEEPILPDPPPPRATYEDQGGPPLPL